VVQWLWPQDRCVRQVEAQHSASQPGNDLTKEELDRSLTNLVQKVVGLHT